MLPSAILQELASLAKQDLLRFELDPKPTLAFQVCTSMKAHGHCITIVRNLEHLLKHWYP